MQLFGYFGTVDYGGSETVDIFHNYDKFYKNIESNYIMKEYSIKSSPRPELLSYQIYGTVEYYWVLLMINKIYDPFYDWLISEQAVHDYAEQKYKNVGGVHQVAYHMNADGEKFWNVAEDPMHPNLWYDKGDVLKQYLQYEGAMVPVTNIEHELNLNEGKRIINIITPTDIKRFVSDIRKQMEISRGRSI